MRINVSKALVCLIVEFLCGASVSTVRSLAAAPSAAPVLPARAALRILEQGTWGPTLADAAALQSTGFEAWFQAQVSAPFSPIPNQPLLDANGKAFTSVGPLQANFYTNTLTGKDQLRQRVAFALSEIWVVSNVDLDRAAAFPPILRMFQNRAFDNYEALMKDITLNPAMGHYLDMANNDKAVPSKNTAANENYARELMQLFTMGLNQLHSNGTPVLDSSGATVPTYTQDTIVNLARMFTGWTYAPVTGVADHTHNPVNFLAPMIAHETEHDTSPKEIFAVKVSAGQTALQDVDQALNIIFNQPSVAPFVSKQLIQHLVTSNPSPDYVGRVAAVFENDGKGVRGDLKAVVHQILADPEARAGDTVPFRGFPEFGHFREPVLFMANLLRGLNGNLTATSNVEAYTNTLGQVLFYSPSVFSYFPPGYQTDGITAPELDIYNTQTSVARTGVVNTAVFNGHLDAATTFNLTPFISAASTTGQQDFFALVSKLFFHEDMSKETMAAMQQAMSAVTSPNDKAKAGLYIALTSSEYQVIH